MLPLAAEFLCPEQRRDRIYEEPAGAQQTSRDRPRTVPSRRPAPLSPPMDKHEIRVHSLRRSSTKASRSTTDSSAG